MDKRTGQNKDNTQYTKDRRNLKNEKKHTYNNYLGLNTANRRH